MIQEVTEIYLRYALIVFRVTQLAPEVIFVETGSDMFWTGSGIYITGNDIYGSGSNFGVTGSDLYGTKID